MSRAGPVSRTASVCRNEFQSGITLGEPARLMADAMNRGRPLRMSTVLPAVLSLP